MARRVARGRFVRPAPRTKIWIGQGLVGSTAIPANSNVLLATLSVGALALRPFTILRTRLLISWATDQVAAVERPHGIFAQKVVTDQAVAIGVTALPIPFTNADADWFTYQPMVLDFVFGTAVGFTPGDSQYMVDSKAMRKVGPNEDEVTVITNMDAADGAEITFIGRQLIMLH